VSRVLRSALYSLQLVGARLADVARTFGTTVICATHDSLLIEQADAELSLGSG